MVIAHQGEDLKVNKNLSVKLVTTDYNNPKVTSIVFNFYAVPRINKTEEEYQASIKNILRRCERIFRRYIHSTNNLFQDKIITNYSFTSANLSQGYNKCVTLSIYVKQKNEYNYPKLWNQVKKTIKECSFELSKLLQEEDFSCYKKKH